jgi:hypothetical protein
MTARVAAANHLGHLMSAQANTTAVPDHDDVATKLEDWRKGWVEARFKDPTAAGEPVGHLTDFQTGFYEMARLLRRAGLPGGHP